MNYKRIIERHLRFLRGEGEQYRANLRGANLIEANLRGANLSGANLRGANLYKANLRGANLYKANLREVNLYKANLSGADLNEANLNEANLIKADLSGADLSGADLSGADGIWYAGFDKRGWVLVIWKKGGNYWVNAGCRSFPKEKALAHWGSKKYPNEKRGEMYVETILFLVEMHEGQK
jgi:hypothetical protein